MKHLSKRRARSGKKAPLLPETLRRLRKRRPNLYELIMRKDKPPSAWEALKKRLGKNDL